MKKLIPLILLTACGPYAADLTFTIGANQKIKKSIEIDQKQTDAQVTANESFLEHLIDIIPYFSTPQPTPTPSPVVKSITLNLVEPVPSPTPKPQVIIERKKSTLTLKPAATPCDNGVFKDYGK